MNVSELKDLLERHGAKPLKSRGQHFLLEDSVVQKMIDAADVKKGESIVEIGPGPGILTEALLATGAKVIALELDLKMQQLLKERFGDAQLHVISGDVLASRTQDIISDGTPYKVVANIPYNITSPIIEKFLLEEPTPTSMTLMIQKEVATRIAAGKGDMSALAVLVQTYASVKKVVKVAKGSFFPPPKVDSTVIHISRKSEQEVKDFFEGIEPSLYFKIVRTAFLGKRKQMRNSLGVFAPDKATLEIWLSSAEISPQARPEDMELSDWVRIAKVISSER